MEIVGAGKRHGVAPRRGGRVYLFAVSDERAGGAAIDPGAVVTDRFGT